jgi:hypothetical protein
MHRGPPESLSHNGPSKASLLVELAADRLGSGEVRLDLHDERCAPPRVKADDIDRATLTADRACHLDHRLPTVRLQSASEPLDDRGMLVIEETFELRSAPPWFELEARVDRAKHGAEPLHGHLCEVAAFDTRNERLGTARPTRQIDLAPASPPAQCTENEAHRTVVHAAMMTPSAYRSVISATREFAAGRWWARPAKCQVAYAGRGRDVATCPIGARGDRRDAPLTAPSRCG